MDGRCVIGLLAAGAAREQFLHAVNRLPLPPAHLVRMHLMLGRDRLDRAVTTQRFQRHPGFELRCESTPFRRISSALLKAWNTP